jgi:hypothetical protein
VVERGKPAPAAPERLQEFRNQLRNLVAQMRSGGVPAARIAAELRALSESLKP